MAIQARADIRRLGILFPPRLLRTPDKLSGEPGAQIAAAEWCRAILRYQPDDAETVIFVADGEENRFKNDIKFLKGMKSANAERVLVVPVSSLQRSLLEKRFSALHTLNTSLGDLAFARSTSGQTFPITCMQYGFSFHKQMSDTVVNMLLAPTYAYDSIICTTNVARAATAKIIHRLKQDLEQRYSISNPTSQFQLSVIPHGVAVDVFKPRDKEELRLQLELPPEPIIILYMGRIDPSSKSDLIPVLMALQKVVKKHGEHVLLVLAGPIWDRYRGKLDEAIEAYGLSGNVVIRTRIPHGSVPLYYSMADIFISISDTLQENFGLTPVEAMASGLPVIVSDWAGYKETVVHNKCGFKIPTLWADCHDDLWPLSPFSDWIVDHFYAGQSVAVDVDIIAQHLDLLVSHQSVRETMGLQAREHVLNNFTWEHCATTFWDLWMRLSENTAASKPTPPSEFLRTRYFDDFSGFATECVNRSEKIEITTRGLNVCSGKEKIIMVNEPRQLLQEALIKKILRFAKFVHSLHVQVDIESVENMFARKHKTTQSVIRRQLMWMLKYNLLHITIN